MYQYTEIDRRVVQERVQQFRGQVQRRLSGELSEDEFLPLRLQNGLYLQRHAYMLRLAVPYGTLSSEQVRMLAYIARRYDRGYGHITTRQNVQYNWPELEEVPDILADLASVSMHAIQTSGNCIRNVTTDHLAGIAEDELEDPRPYCEVLRQWSTFHPEFAYLPRKFKIAVSGATNDRAAVPFHDIGLRIIRNDEGELGFEVWVGGGLGRTPVVAQVVREFLPKRYLLSYVEAVLRVYNLHGTRNNKYRARIKILLKDLGLDAFRAAVEAEWTEIRDGALEIRDEEVQRIAASFSTEYDPEAASNQRHQEFLGENPDFAAWFEVNVVKQKAPGYFAAVIPLKTPLRAPGDITHKELDAVADLADQFGSATVRTTHEQNLVIPDVKGEDLIGLWQELAKHDLATPNVGTIQDMICCPGLDYCALANAGSIEVAKQITDRFADTEKARLLGELKVKMSGCINACGHHHVGHIGILGIDKSGEERFQLMLGGSATDDTSLGRFIGPSVAKDAVAESIHRMLVVYADRRESGERFLDTYRRIGHKPFKEAVYADH